ncbi:MAG: DegT/DnrJ/EryC1/StrS family aminotransferase [Lentisphaerae bacterium]|nr:DegT/DnrJ/EryC1/StrS family aminotransferase [Lentisphaerota bacterium]
MKNPKYGVDELMELIDVFAVPEQTQKQIRALLEPDNCDAGVFFRYYNQRSKSEEFEKAYARFSGSKYVLALNSGTSALIAALVAAGVGPGTEVIVPAYTFFASASAVIVAKGIPVIADVDETLTLSPESVEKLITPRTKAIIPVHMLGYPSQMDKLMAIAKKHNLRVIEDAAQACGGSFQGQFLGSIGDFGCISLDAYKVIGSGEGGILTAKDEWMFTRAQSYHDTGACWRPDRYAKERREGELFCGENYRMSELSAAVALAQLRKLAQITKETRDNFFMLRDMLKLPPGVKHVQAADPAGLCGYTMALLFDDPEYSRRAQNAGLLGGNAGDSTRGVRNWHMAWYWEQILEQKTPTPEGCPFKCPFAVDVPKYEQNSWPQSMNIISRLATLGVNRWQSQEELQAVAEKISKGLLTC